MAEASELVAQTELHDSIVRNERVRLARGRRRIDQPAERTHRIQIQRDVAASRAGEIHGIRHVEHFPSELERMTFDRHVKILRDAKVDGEETPRTNIVSRT